MMVTFRFYSAVQPIPVSEGAQLLPAQGNALVVLHKSRQTPAGLPGAARF